MPYILEKVRVRLQKLFLIYGITLHASSGGGVTAPIRVAANVGYWGGSTHPWKQEDTERNSVKNTVADIDYQRFGGSFLKFEQYDKNLKACHSSQERIDYLKLMDTFSYDRFVARD